MTTSYPRRRGLALAVGLMLAAAIAACDRSPTEPHALTRVNGKTLSIEGDTTLCQHGWIIVNGRYVCSDPT